MTIIHTLPDKECPCDGRESSRTLGTLCLLALVQEGYVTSAYTTDALNLTDLISETDLHALNIFFGSTIADTIAVSEDIFVKDTDPEGILLCTDRGFIYMASIMLCNCFL